MLNQNTKIKKIIAVLFLVLIVNISVVSSVSAQLATYDAGLNAQEIKKSFLEKIWDAVKGAGLLALNNAAIRIGSEAGRNTAQYIASGGNGGSPMLLSKSALEYATDAGEDALGDFIGSLNENWGDKLGLDLCDPGVLSLGLKAQMSITFIKMQTPQSVKPKCDWQDVQKNWASFVQSATSEEYLKAMMPQLEFKNTQIGMLATLASKADEEKNTNVSNVLSRLTGKSFNDKIDPVTGAIILPSIDLDQKYRDLIETDKEKQKEVLENARTSKNPLSILVKSFFSSMVGELQTKLVTVLTGKARSKSITGSESGLSQLNRARQAEAVFSELLTAEIKTGGTMDILGEFAACPSDSRYAQPNNCVIDQNFSKAIQEKLTIKQAIDKGYLHGDWYVASPDEEDGPDDYLGRYSLTNIKKLRKARIVPLGLEIAANIIYNKQATKSNVTLNEIVNGYYNPSYDYRDPETDSEVDAGEWWHLVDPEWVLDAPEVRCAAQVYGSVPQSESSTRQEVCASWENCIYKDKNGSCLDWGYCLKEKLDRDFGGTECSSQYASCRTYTRESDGQEFAYLQKSLDFSLCDANNYGCYWYSTSKNNSLTDWLSTSRVYLNHNVSECDASEGGCSEFIELKSIATNKVLDKDGYDTAIENAARDNSPVSYENAYNIVKKYIKKAPDYYNCYDRDLTTGKLITSNDAEECANYALACSDKEVGCQKYTPKDGSSWIPAIANDADSCPAECDGYASFLQQPLWWDSAITFLEDSEDEEDEGDDEEDEVAFPTAGFVNFIAKTAKKCSANQVGCEAYTNLSSSTESSESFTHAQTCQLPENDLCQTYYTWQGSDTSGYQLKSYSLLKNSENSKPCTMMDLASVNTANLLSAVTCNQSDECSRGVCNTANTDGISHGKCNSDANCITLGGVAGECFMTNPNCYEFYTAGDSASVYYADITKVTTCTDSCSLYRKNRADVTTDSEKVYDKADCPNFGLWLEDSKECLLALDPIKSSTCSANSIGCREYAGSESGNVRRVFRDDFENGVSDVWQAGEIIFEGNPYFASKPEISTESVYVGGSSLKALPGRTGRAVPAGVTRSLDGLVVNDKTYTLSFLAKGITNTTEENLYVEFTSGTNKFTEKLNLTDNWNTYEVGPVSLDWSLANKKFTIVNNPAGDSTFFLDDIILKETNNDYYLIKDSWYTPSACEVAPVLSYGSSTNGSMLGCRQYTDESGLTVYLKSFTNLCGEDKVGCKILVDTKNSTTARSQDFNRYTCVGGSNNGGRSYEACPLGETCTDAGTCSITTRKSCDCPGGGVSVENTGSPDVLSVLQDEAVYLVDDSNKYCNAQNKGCSLLGVPSFDAENKPITNGYGDTFLINNPDLYISTVDNPVSNPILCRETEDKCEKFKTSTGSETYFVDPEGFTCEYKEEVSVGSGNYITGWFKSGTTVPCNCDDVSNPTCYAEPPTFTPSVPNNRGAICPASEDMCTEFIDPMTTSSIYYVKNDELTKNDCNGMVSEKTGCLLYSDTSVVDNLNNVLNTWNATATYNASDTLSKAPVSPENRDPKDSNIILQKKDVNRACAEWLECNTWEYQWDNANSKYKKVCTGFGKCNKMNSNGSGCAVNGWVSTAKAGTACTTEGTRDTDLVCLGSPLRWTPETLTKEAYQNRNIVLNNFGAEYSGYSIFGLYPTETLKETKYSDGLYYLSSNVSGNAGVGIKECDTDADCSPRLTSQVCRKLTASDLKGKCVIPKTCRGYPETDSPFDKASTYLNVNKCSEAKKVTDDAGYSLDTIGDGCNCHYVKSTYAGQAVYSNLSSITRTAGICTSGSAEAVTSQRSCDTKANCCGTNSEQSNNATVDFNSATGMCNSEDVPTCTYKSREDTFYGWEGICLEPDPSKTNLANNTFSCLTWFPSDKLASAVDIYNMNAGAGYRPTANNSWYGVSGVDGGIRIGVGKIRGFSSGEIIPLRPSDPFKDLVLTGNINLFVNRHGPNAIEGGHPTGDDHNDSGDVYNYGEWKLKTEYQSKFRIDDVGSVIVQLHTDDGDSGLVGGGDIGAPVALINSNKWYGCLQSGEAPGVLGDCATRDLFKNSDICYLEGGDTTCAIEIQSNGNQNVCPNGDSAIVARAAISNGFLTGVYWYWCEDASTGSAVGHGELSNLTIILKTGAEYAINIAAPDRMAKAYTNRLWEVSKYYVENDGDVRCKPYGAIGSSDTSSWVAKNFGTPEEIAACYSNQVGVVHKVVGEANFRDLFARTFGTLKYNYDNSTASNFLTYTPDSTNGYFWNDTTAPSDLLDPRYPAISSYSSKNTATTNDTFSVNDFVGQDVPVYDNNAAVKFYAWANEDHMPVTQIELDWGDGFVGGSTAGNMSAKNKKPSCEKVCTVVDAGGKITEDDTGRTRSCETDKECIDVASGEKCLPLTFGDTTEACTEGWWEYRHMYTCRKDMNVVGQPQIYFEACGDPKVSGPCCKFNPKVTVTDNWDWSKSFSFGHNVIVPYTE